MEVEIYAVDTAAGTVAPDDVNEARELIEKLGLEGQSQFLAGEANEAFSYPALSREEVAVYRTLFPTRTKLQNFDEEMIPLRVLQEADRVGRLRPNYKLEVWHSRTYTDPLLVAGTGGWGDPWYLIARWGEALETWETLRRRAVETLAAKLRAEAKRMAAILPALDYEAEVEAALAGDRREYAVKVSLPGAI